MPAFSELSLPSFDHTDATLRGESFRRAMESLEGHEGWLATTPYGPLVLDREAGEFFLRTRAAVFPGLRIGEMFGVEDGPLHEEILANIINVNGDDHRRLRNLVNPALSPRRVERYRPAMRQFLDELLKDQPGEEPFDFIERFAKPYPSLVIAHVMGAPLSDAPRLHHWSNLIQQQFDPASLLNERPELERAVTEFYAYAEGLIADRRRQPGEDLITDLIGAEEQSGKLSHHELRNLVLNILVGGVDTSQSQLAHAVRLLAEHPDQWQALREDPRGRALPAVDEALRYEPITPFTARITESEVEYRGVTFPPGTIVMISAWHANLQDDASFDITAEHPHARVLTFGAGIHYCVGANLARAEMQEALAHLAEHVEEIQLAGEPQFGTPAGIYGLISLPLSLKCSTPR